MSCNDYILWGDVIRGCYRRQAALESNGQHPDVASDDMFLSDEDEDVVLEDTPVKKRRASWSKSPRSMKGKQRAQESSQSSEGESFDFTNLNSSSESDVATPLAKRKPGRPRKHPGVFSSVVTPALPSRARKTSVSPSRTSVRKMGTKENPISLSSGSSSSLDGERSPSTEKKSGRPRKNTSTAMPDPLSPVSSLAGEGIKGGGSLDNRVAPSKSTGHEISLLKPKRGRPRKNSGLSSPEAPSVRTPKKSTPKKSAGAEALLPPPKQRMPLSNEGKARCMAASSASGPNEGFNSGHTLSPIDDNFASPVKKRPGRPRKRVEQSPINTVQSSSSDGETFHFSEVTSSAEDNHIILVKKHGRAQKIIGQDRKPSQNEMNKRQFHFLASDVENILIDVSSHEGPSIFSKSRNSTLPSSTDNHVDDIEKAIAALSIRRPVTSPHNEPLDEDVVSFSD